MVFMCFIFLLIYKYAVSEKIVYISPQIFYHATKYLIKGN